MNREKFKTFITYANLIILAVIFSAPFLWLIFVSFGPASESITQLLPKKFTLENFVTVWQAIPLPKYLLNSVIITAVGVFLEILLASLAAYPLARMEFPGKNFIFYALISTLLLPTQAVMIANFITCVKLNLVNTYTAVLLPTAVSVFGIFLMRQAYITVPKELEESARLDGCSDFYIWWKIMLPLTRPALATLAVFSFVNYWNVFMWPLIILQSTSKYPLSVGLAYLQGTFATDFRMVAAGAVISTIPTIIIFLLLQKQFVSGIMSGSGK